MIIDGIKIKNEILESIKKEVEALPFTPVFCDILVGADPVSLSYVRIKAKTAESIGIKFRTAEFPESITTEELITEIQHLNKVPHMCGIIVQLPLPASIRKDEVLDAISPALDVDCLSSICARDFYSSGNGLKFPTALACMHVLDSLGIDLVGKNIVVLGQGSLVGRPVTHLLKERMFSVSTINRQTENSPELIANADVIVSAIGQGKFITGHMIKNGAIIIDAGTSEENGAVVGDVDLESVRDVASWVSPTPKGVGPVTVGMLLSNVLSVAKKKANE